MMHVDTASSGDLDGVGLGLEIKVVNYQGRAHSSPGERGKKPPSRLIPGSRRTLHRAHRIPPLVMHDRPADLTGITV
jgi:hypothetical protein